MGKMMIILIIQIFKASPSRVRWRRSGKRGKQVVFGRQRGSLFNGGEPWKSWNMLIESQNIEVYFRIMLMAKPILGHMQMGYMDYSSNIICRPLPKYRQVTRKFWSMIHWFLGFKMVWSLSSKSTHTHTYIYYNVLQCTIIYIYILWHVAGYSILKLTWTLSQSFVPQIWLMRSHTCNDLFPGRSCRSSPR